MEGLTDQPLRYEPGLSGLLRGILRRWRMQLTAWRRDWLPFLSKPTAIIGLAIIAVFGVLALLHPLLMQTIWDKTTYDPVVGFEFDMGPHPTQPSARHLLGTDSKGRDVLSQLIFSARTSFGVGLLAALVGTVLATVFGLLAAYFRGPVEAATLAFADAMVLLPPQVVLLIVGLIFPMSWLHVGLLFGVFAGLGSLTLLVKAQAATLRAKPYVQAARLAGGGSWHIIRVHILPGLASLIAVNMLFMANSAIMIEALLSFLGRAESRMSWGTMIWLTQITFRESAFGEQWHVIIPPALAIMLFAGSFYLVGRALDEYVNPRLRQR
ncbi:MAG TPA: ABC transporter permease [Anaerolineales bacterium]